MSGTGDEIEVRPR